MRSWLSNSRRHWPSPTAAVRLVESTMSVKITVMHSTFGLA